MRREERDMRGKLLARICAVIVLCFAGEAFAQLPVAPVLPAVSHRLPASFATRNCTADQRRILQTAADEAKRLLIAGGSPSLFFRWFGLLDLSQQTQDLKNAVQFVRIFSLDSLTLIAAGVSSVPLVTFDCNGRSVQFPAHVTGAGTGVVFINAPFWTLSNSPRDNFQHVSKASVIIHELTHLAGTGDFHLQFGYSDPFQFAFDLARLWPVVTFLNAGNHEFYYIGE
jgi:hypothetical protein